MQYRFAVQIMQYYSPEFPILSMKLYVLNRLQKFLFHIGIFYTISRLHKCSTDLQIFKQAPEIPISYRNFCC